MKNKKADGINIFDKRNAFNIEDLFCKKMPVEKNGNMIFTHIKLSEIKKHMHSSNY